MAPSRALRSRKKQTRLEFQPLSTSSPTKELYSQAVQDRLASVRFVGSRHTRAAAQLLDEGEDTLPTPHPTSPTGSQAQVKTSSPLSSLRTSPPVPPRFAPDDYDDSSDEDEILPPSSKRRKLFDPQETDFMGNLTSMTDPSSMKTASDSRRTKSLRSLQIASLSTPTRRSKRLISHKLSPLHSTSSISSQNLASVDIPTPPRPVSNLGSAETSDDGGADALVTAPRIKRRSKPQKSPQDDDFVVEDDYDIRSQPTSRPSRSRGKAPRRRQNEDDFVVDNDEIEYISSDENDMSRASSVNARKSSERERRKRSRQRSRREREELEEDLLDLQDSEQETSTQKQRTRGGPVTTQRDKTREHFERLKRSRAGQRAPRVIDSDDEDDHSPAGEEFLGADINTIGKSPDRFQIVSDGATSSVEGEDNQEMPPYEDEDDFVVEDTIDTGRLGRPNSDIPLQFTSFASAKPRELFVHVVEWMIKNKISPAFNRHDEVYTLSLSRIDDQVKAQAGSRLISSAWNATFRWAILARPGMHVVALPGLDEDLIRTCDACNKSNHPARYDFTFSGKAYSKDTLEPIYDSDEEDEDTDGENEDETDKVSRDEQNHVLASQNMHFYLGRFCAANAEMGHKLTHWKHHLNEQVLAYLEEQGVLSAEAIVAREKLNKKKRERGAENIVDMMQETNVIAELWQGFQDDLEDARIGMEGHERRGGRGKKRIGSVRVQRDNGTVGDWIEGGKFRQIATQLQSDSEGE